MSLTISWCPVCQDGSLENDPMLVGCGKCGFSFHRKCAVNSWYIDDEYDDLQNLSSSHCPACQGKYIAPEENYEREFLRGLVTAYNENSQDIELDNIRTINQLEATVLGAKAQTLALNSMWDLSADVAQGLLQCTGDLYLNGIKAVSDEVAVILTTHKGNIYLEGLKIASEKAWSALIESPKCHVPNTHNKDSDFDDVFTLPEFAAEILSNFDKTLSLGGLTEISDQALKILVTHNGGLALHGLNRISDVGAELLTVYAKDNYLDIRGLENASPHAWKLLRSNADIQLPE